MVVEIVVEVAVEEQVVEVAFYYSPAQNPGLKSNIRIKHIFSQNSCAINNAANREFAA